MTHEQEHHGGGITKLKLALGAASLFLFIVGVKRSFRTEEGEEILQNEPEPVPGEPAEEARPRRMRAAGR